MRYGRCSVGDAEYGCVTPGARSSRSSQAPFLASSRLRFVIYSVLAGLGAARGRFANSASILLRRQHRPQLLYGRVCRDAVLSAQRFDLTVLDELIGPVDSHYRGRQAQVSQLC
jgi:hypothetical protein